MEEYIKTRKRCKITSIIMAVLTMLAFIACLSLEFLVEIENDIAIIVFLCALVCAVVAVILLVIFYKSNKKNVRKMLDQLNQEIEDDFTYVSDVPISDLILDSKYPCDHQANSIDGIVGKLDDVSFEYYLFRFYDDSFLPSSFNKMGFELYIYQDVSVFHKQFFVTDKKVKNATDYKILPTDGVARIYTIKEEEFPFLPLPEGVVFLSVQGRALYVVKPFSRKKALYEEAKTLDEFKVKFSQEIEKIKNTYEDAKYWIS